MEFPHNWTGVVCFEGESQHIQFWKVIKNKDKDKHRDTGLCQYCIQHLYEQSF